MCCVDDFASWLHGLEFWAWKEKSSFGQYRYHGGCRPFYEE
jgi:hypothetical protein